jgi:general stress protein 26
VIEFAEEMRDALAKALDERAPCIVATADAQGWANPSYRGSVSVYSDDELSFWNRNRTETVKNIEQNPRATVFYRNRDRKVNWRFFGDARIVTNETERNRIMEITDPREMAADPDRKGIGVIVKVRRVLDPTGASVMES